MSNVEGLLLISLILFTLILCLKLYLKLKSERECFIKTLSHDLRVSAIAQIRGLEVLQKNLSPNSFESELISSINDSCKFSLDMISTLLNTFKYENKEKFLNYTSFNLNDIIKDTINQNLKILEDKNIQICINSNKVNNINADRQSIIKVIQILITTISAYAKNNTKVNIKIDSSAKELYCQFFYKGKSLSEEECRRMFSKSPKYSIVGQGIRMYLCKKIIDFHNGKIEVLNYSDQINSFKIILPITGKTEILNLDRIKNLSMF